MSWHPMVMNGSAAPAAVAGLVSVLLLIRLAPLFPLSVP